MMQINASLHLDCTQSCIVWYVSTGSTCTKEQTGSAFLISPGLPRKLFSSAMKLSQILTKQLVCNKMKLRLQKRWVPVKGEGREQSRE